MIEIVHIYIEHVLSKKYFLSDYINCVLKEVVWKIISSEKLSQNIYSKASSEMC